FYGQWPADVRGDLVDRPSRFSAPPSSRPQEYRTFLITRFRFIESGLAITRCGRQLQYCPHTRDTVRRQPPGTLKLLDLSHDLFVIYPLQHGSYCSALDQRQFPVEPGHERPTFPRSQFFLVVGRHPPEEQIISGPLLDDFIEIEHLCFITDHASRSLSLESDQRHIIWAAFFIMKAQYGGFVRLPELSYAAFVVL